MYENPLNFPLTRPDTSPLEDGDQYTGDNGVIYTYNNGVWDGIAQGLQGTPALGDRLTTGSYSVILGADGLLTLPNGTAIGDKTGTGAITIGPAVDTFNINNVIGTFPGLDFSSPNGVAVGWLVNGPGVTNATILGIDVINGFIEIDGGVFQVGESYTFTGTSSISIGTKITVNSNDWTFGADGNLTLPDANTLHYTSGINFNFEGYNFNRIRNHNSSVFLEGVEDAPPGYEVYGKGAVLTQLAVSGVDVSISTDIQGQNNGWTFGTDGKLTIPGEIAVTDTQTITNLTVYDQTTEYGGAGGPNALSIGEVAFPSAIIDINVGATFIYSGDPSKSATVVSPVIQGPTGTYIIPIGNTDSAQFDGSIDITYTRNKVWTYSPDGTFTLPNGTNIYGDRIFKADAVGGFELNSFTDNIGGGKQTWTFGTDGKLQLPAGGDIVDSNGDTVLGGGSTGTSWNLTSQGNGCPIDVTLTTTTFDVHVPRNHLLFNEDGSWDIGSYTNGNYITGDTSANFNILTNFGQTTWTFGADGTTIIPDNSTIRTSGYGSISLKSDNADIVIMTDMDNSRSWTFGGNHTLIFPDTSVQTTAWNDQAFMASMASYDGAIVTNTATIGTGGLTVNGPVQFNGPFTFQGTATVINSNSGTFYGDVTGVGALYAGVAGSTPLPATVIQSAADVNDYIQNNFQNLNHGNQASTEWVATNDLGNDSNNYIDMGIAGHGWDGTQANSVGTAAGPSDSWVYTQGTVSSSEGGNLILGTIKDGKAVKILAGSNGAGSLVAQFNSSGLALTTGTSITFPDGTRQTSAISQSYVTGLGYTTTASVNILIANSLTNVVKTIVAGTGTAVSVSGNTVTIWTTASGGIANLNNLSSDISFSTVGVGAPTFNTTSTGVKISYYPSESATMVDYATGIEAGVLWNSIPSATSNFAFKWYGGTSTVATLNGLGTLTATKFVGDGSSLTNVTVTQQANIVGIQPNVTLVAGNYSYLFDNTGTFTMPVNGNIVMPGANTNLTVGGNLTVTGNITSTPVGFRATTPVTNVSVNNGSTVTMLFGTEEVDTNSAYNPATGRFTPNAAGYYSIDWFIVTNANGAGELIASLYKNGVLVAWGTNQTTATAHWNGIGGSAGMIYLNGTTDYISITLTNNSGSTATILAASSLSYFSAYLIR